ncbi:NADH dehydrogenase subunit M [Desulfuromonas sp. AOP6]|nr:NADH-quinone oxidoreductase subunit M [Desulfuromonas sp. AOP6]BCA80920.1 NADH dehydrogenase subunit M [Desulfuromonas sp. AOP6]
MPLLSLLVWLPLLGALTCLLLRPYTGAGRWTALAVTTAVFSLNLWAFLESRGLDGWLWQEDHAWIPRYGIRYTLGMDGLSLTLTLLTAFLLVIAVLISWRLDVHTHFFFSLLLLIESGIMGVFLALDLVLFYLFWEVMLIPMFFLIGVWGHENRLYAAVKFFLFTLAGSLLMLLAMITLYLVHGDQSGHYTFALASLVDTQLPPALSWWLFGAFFAAFAVKVPLFPLHTWLPDAHTEAPTAGSVILAGVLLKTGVYGLLRYGFPLFPEPARASLPVLGVLSLIAIFYAAWIAYTQSDAKRLIAYSSVAHMGFVILGIAAWNTTALEGSLLQMVNHGITTGALFALIGMIDARAHTREISELGGLWAKAPVLGAFFLFFALASLGLPGLNNFTGEILILIGTFAVHPLWASLGLVGVLFAAIYMLRLVQGVLWGQSHSTQDWGDISWRETLILAPLALLVLWLGLYPHPFLEPLREPVQRLLLESSLRGLGGLP